MITRILCILLVYIHIGANLEKNAQHKYKQRAGKFSA